MASIMEVFTPAAPVSNVDLFAGRIEQLSEVLNVTDQAGTHGVLYGERGVGKTSLASTMVNILIARGQLAVRASCDSADDYRTVWRKALDNIKWMEHRQATGFGSALKEAVQSAAQLLPKDAGPGDILNVLESLSPLGPPVIFLDEFERIQDVRVRSLFADTIKMLSDHAVDATIVLVGVADTVDELVNEHASVERALVQIQMPRMSRDELEVIVHQGLTAVGMDIETDGLVRLTSLSQGLPHYTHLIAQQAAVAAVRHQRVTVTREDVDTAVGRAIERAQRSIINAYHTAVASPQRTTLYAQVLLATALAQGDELGFFAPADVRAPLSAIMHRGYEIPSFVRHLHALSDDERGAVLQKRGQKNAWRYRFSNPLLQPYVVMHGLKEELLDSETLELFS
jgi:Cdc6-like AAA superfamily ATPase